MRLLKVAEGDTSKTPVAGYTFRVEAADGSVVLPAVTTGTSAVDLGELTVGQTYSFDRYFRPDRNPVRITVLRRERITVPAGTFDAIVLQPIIKTKGIFSENGHAEIWLSDDDRRIMLQLKSKLSFGSLNLYLKSYFPSPNP